MKNLAHAWCSKGEQNWRSLEHFGPHLLLDMDMSSPQRETMVLTGRQPRYFIFCTFFFVLVKFSLFFQENSYMPNWGSTTSGSQVNVVLRTLCCTKCVGATQRSMTTEGGKQLDLFEFLEKEFTIIILVNIWAAQFKSLRETSGWGCLNGHIR